MGSNFVHHVLATHPDYEVVNLDALTYAGNLENLRDLEGNGRYHFFKGDITNEATVAHVFETYRPSVVLNFAAETHVDRSILGPKAFILTDVIGTYTLLEACKRFGIDRYVQISTDEVYGSIKEGQFTEESPFRPNSPYSASKAGGDHLVRAYHQTYGIPVIQTHSCNVFGPYQYPEKFIPLFTTNLIEGEKVPLYGDGSHQREWIFVTDYCRAVDLIWHQGTVGESYNIGSGWEQSNKDVALALLSLFDKSEDEIEHVEDRLGHDWRYAVDATKLMSLGWTPLSSFEARLRETVEWYKNNPDWWKPLKAQLNH